MINEINLSESSAFLEQEEFEVISEGNTRSGCLQHHQLAETTDNYEHIVKQIDDKHRIIRCVDNIQFISQTRTGGQSQYPWRSESYYMTKAGANRQSYPYRDAALSLFEATP